MSLRDKELRQNCRRIQRGTKTHVVLALEVASGIELLERLVAVRGVESVLVRLGLRESSDSVELVDGERAHLEDVPGLLEFDLSRLVLAFSLGEGLHKRRQLAPEANSGLERTFLYLYSLAVALLQRVKQISVQLLPRLNPRQTHSTAFCAFAMLCVPDLKVSLGPYSSSDGPNAPWHSSSPPSTPSQYPSSPS